MFSSLVRVFRKRKFLLGIWYSTDGGLIAIR